MGISAAALPVAWTVVYVFGVCIGTGIDTGRAETEQDELRWQHL